jgi:RNA polymerase sigma-70 factor, ECF subfamily
MLNGFGAQEPLQTVETFMGSSPQHSRARLVALPSPTLAQADDATLARAASSGDPRATGVLWDRFSPLARRMLRRTLGPDAEVEGLLQEVFLRVVKHLGCLAESAQIKPFVIGVTVRVLNSELRRNRLRRLFRLRSPWRTYEAGGAAADAGTRSALCSLYRILDELDADARLAFTLRHFEGLQLTELASAMDASLPAAKRSLARANARVQAAVVRDSAFSAYATAVSLGDAQ